MTDLKHIFFDLDHTLWDFDRNSRETLAELFDDYKLAEITSATAVDQFIERYLHHNERFWSLYRRNRISKSRLRKARFEAVLQDFRVQDKALAKRIGNAYIDQCPRKPHLNDQAMEVVRTLSAHFTLHIITNGFQETQSIKLETSGLSPYFTEVITSERAQAKKPNPRIFTFAERVTGARKDESVMIGDSLEIDVQGAVDFGWRAIHFSPEAQNHSFPQVPHLSGLKSLLLQ